MKYILEKISASELTGTSQPTLIQDFIRMPNVIPYRAFFYSQELASDLSKLVSPPYDVISQEQHLELIQRHPLNSVGLCLPDSVEDPDRYRNMKSRLNEWKQKKVFETSPQPAFYLVEEKYEG